MRQTQRGGEWKPRENMENEMRYFDADEAAKINAEDWQIALLGANPGYCSWGPHEDYMWKDGAGWDSAIIVPTWADFGPWDLDDLNECVHFYFSVERKSEDCATCGGNGYHPDAQWVSESFYSHSSPFKHKTPREEAAAAVMAKFALPREPLIAHGSYPSDELLAKYGPDFAAFCEEMRRHGSWSERLTQDEVDALKAAGRGAAGPIGHDAINRWVLIEQRCKRLGIPKQCPTCDGDGRVYTAPAAHVSLTLWWLHPRKGCSRGMEIERIERDDLPAVQTFLAEAARRNAERFAGIARIA